MPNEEMLLHVLCAYRHPGEWTSTTIDREHLLGRHLLLGHFDRIMTAPLFAFKFCDTYLRLLMLSLLDHFRWHHVFHGPDDPRLSTHTEALQLADFRKTAFGQKSPFPRLFKLLS